MLKFLQLWNKKDLTVLSFLLFLVGFSIPFSFAFNSICIGLLFLFSFKWYQKRKYKYTYIFKNTLFYFILFFILQIISIAYALDKPQALKTVERSVPFLLFPIIFINLGNVINKKLVNFSVIGMMLGTVLLLLSAQLNILFEIFKDNLDFNLIITNYVRVEFLEKALVFVHSTYLGLLILFSIIFTLYQKWSIYVKVPFILYLSFSIYEISSMMIFALMCVIFFIKLFLPLFLKFNKIFFVGFFLVIFSTAFIISIINNSTNKWSGNSLFKRIEWVLKKGDTSRPHNWNSVVEVISRNVILGVGADGGIEQLQLFREHNRESYINKHNAHNQYLEVLLRYGLIGFFFFVFLISKILKKAIVVKDKVLLWLLIIIMCTCITESILERQIGIVFFTFY